MTNIFEDCWIQRANIQDKETLVHLAKLADQVERYNDMAYVMKKVTEISKELDNEERNLLSVAFKNVVGSRRSSWRVVSNLEQKTKDNKKKQAEEYRKTIEAELQSICNIVLDMLTDTLIPNEKSNDGLVFFWKMKGDYLRYLAEIQTGDERADVVQRSKDAYVAATEKAEKELASIHPIRLGLALNFSVFYYEIENNPNKACEIAKAAFDSAITQLDESDTDSCRDSMLVLQLIRDNLALWTSEDPKLNPQKE